MIFKCNQGVLAVSLIIYNSIQNEDGKHYVYVQHKMMMIMIWWGFSIGSDGGCLGWLRYWDELRWWQWCWFDVGNDNGSSGRWQLFDDDDDDDDDDDEDDSASQRQLRWRWRLRTVTVTVSVTRRLISWSILCGTWGTSLQTHMWLFRPCQAEETSL